MGVWRLLFFSSHFVFHLLHLFNGFVFGLNVFFNLFQILRTPSIIPFITISFWFGDGLWRSKYILNSIRNNKIFIWLEPHYWFIILSYNRGFSVHFFLWSSGNRLRTFGLFTNSSSAHCACKFLTIGSWIRFIFSF